MNSIEFESICAHLWYRAEKQISDLAGKLAFDGYNRACIASVP
jgi:hypothetical protein